MWAYTLLVYLVPAMVAVAAAYVAVTSTRFFLSQARRPSDRQPGQS